MQKEIWKDIDGFEGRYQVSNLGNVRSLLRNPTKILHQALNGKKTYRRISLYKNRILTSHCVHRLVAAAFISNPNNLPEVNHKDWNTLNNNVNNLEWCDRIYNLKNRKKGSCSVKQYSLNGEFIKEWETSAAAAEANGFDDSTIIKCCRGKRETHKGYRWEYSYNNERL